MWEDSAIVEAKRNEAHRTRLNQREKSVKHWMLVEGNGICFGMQESGFSFWVS